MCHLQNKYGGYRQVVKTQGCGSCMRRFESDYPPHFFNKKLRLNKVHGQGLKLPHFFYLSFLMSL